MQEREGLDMSWVEVQFLRNAVDVLQKSRQILMFTYVFAFYLQKSNNTTIFEDNQVIIILLNIFKITFVFELGEFGTGDGKTVRILGTRDARDY